MSKDMDLIQKRTDGPQAEEPSRLQFQDLPREVKLDIMSYLNQRDLLLRVPLVCKEWNAISKTYSVWQRVHLDSMSSKAIRKNLMNRYSPCVKLVRIDCHGYIDSILYAMATNFPNIRHLILSNGYLANPYTMNMVANGCKYLEEITVRDFHFPTQFIWSYLGPFAALQRLNLEYLFPLTVGMSLRREYNMNVSGSFLSKISEINLNASWIRDDDMRNLLEKMADTLVKLTFNGKMLTDDTYYHLRDCKKLEVLNISNAKRMNHAGFVYGVGQLTMLRWLRIHWGWLIKPSAIAIVAKSGRLCHVERLELPECGFVNDACLTVIASECPILTHLDVSRCMKITDQGIAGVIMSCPKLANVITLGLKDDVTEASRQLLLAKSGFEQLDQVVNRKRLFQNCIISSDHNYCRSSNIEEVPAKRGHFGR